jgi:hypothetical protein
MPFKYSICHVDKPNIEYPKNILTAEEVKEIVHNYSWKKELKKLQSISPNQGYYSPSLDFTNLANNYSFCLSAGGEDPENFSFYIWYNRKVKKKILFGLLGEKDRFDLIDKWFTEEAGYLLLDNFLSDNYELIEKLMIDS